MQSIDSYTKLLLHGDGTDTSTFIPDSSALDMGVLSTSGTVLMLHFDGADAATATTDAATNKAVTFVGTAQIDTAQSKFGGSSLLLDGDGDHVTLLDSADWDLGTGDFTIETWIRFNALPGSGLGFGICGQLTSGGERWSFRILESAGNYQLRIRVVSDSEGSNIDIGSSAFALSTNTWYHFAVTRVGSTFYFFVDGTGQGTASDADSMPDIADVLWVGGDNSLTDVNGWIDDFRIIKGKALYTADFTPCSPPAPVGTVLKLAFNGADAAVATVDDAKDKAVTFVGTAALDTAQYKFGASSLLLDGNSDYVSLADSADFDFGSGDFTIECWIRRATVADNDCLCAKFADTGNYSFRLICNSTDVNFVYSTTGSNQTSKWVSWTASTNTWYHLAVVRNGNNLMFFVDGTQQGATQDVTGVTIFDSNAAFQVGADKPPTEDGYWFDGHIDDFRIVKGTAVYTANFTAPTAPVPPTPVSPSPKDVTCVGNAQIDTAQKVFGTGSILFDGTGDYLTIGDATSSDWDFGSGDFTIDAWIRFASVTGQNLIQIVKKDKTDNVNQVWALQAYWNDPDPGYPRLYFDYYDTSAHDIYVTKAVAWNANQWYHVAFVRSGNNGYFFVDGVQEGATKDFTGVTITTSTLPVEINEDQGGTAGSAGWIDEFRISKGVARWTANFTPPDRPYSQDRDSSVNDTSTIAENLGFEIINLDLSKSVSDSITILEDFTPYKYSTYWELSVIQTISITENLSDILDVLNVHVG